MKRGLKLSIYVIFGLLLLFLIFFSTGLFNKITGKVLIETPSATTTTEDNYIEKECQVSSECNSYSCSDGTKIQEECINGTCILNKICGKEVECNVDFDCGQYFCNNNRTLDEKCIGGLCVLTERCPESYCSGNFCQIYLQESVNYKNNTISINFITETTVNLIVNGKILPSMKESETYPLTNEIMKIEEIIYSSRLYGPGIVEISFTTPLKEDNCFDTDGGDHSYVSGQVRLLNYYEYESQNMSDSCYDSSKFPYHKNLENCSGPSCQVQEYICIDLNEDNYTDTYNSHFINCENGCSKGACNPKKDIEETSLLKRIFFWIK